MALHLARRRILPLIALLAAAGACGRAADEPPTTTTTSPPSTVAPVTAAPPTTLPPPQSTSAAHWVRPLDACHPARHPQPGGPFVAVIECGPDGAASLRIARGGQDDDPQRRAAWPASGEPWAERAWSTDVSSLAWAPDRERVFVATSDLHGAGGFFELDLGARKARQMMPAGDAVTPEQPGPGYLIMSMDGERQVLRYQVAPWNPQDRGAAISFARR
jgi:hypothetical protein